LIQELKLKVEKVDPEEQLQYKKETFEELNNIKENIEKYKKELKI
jgi:hypothetical protein